MKYARWQRIIKKDKTTIWTVLRAGKKGAGRLLGACSYRLESQDSQEDCFSEQYEIERYVEKLGYAIIRDQSGGI